MDEAQKRFGNPHHVINVFAVNGDEVRLVDPALDESENPIVTTLEKLYFALDDTQQIIFIGEKGK